MQILIWVLRWRQGTTVPKWKNDSQTGLNTWSKLCSWWMQHFCSATWSLKAGGLPGTALQVLSWRKQYVSVKCTQAGKVRCKVKNMACKMMSAVRWCWREQINDSRSVLERSVVYKYDFFREAWKRMSFHLGHKGGVQTKITLQNISQVWQVDAGPWAGGPTIPQACNLLPNALDDLWYVLWKIFCFSSLQFLKSSWRSQYYSA